MKYLQINNIGDSYAAPSGVSRGARFVTAP